MFLQHLGLDTQAELIYNTILEHPTATVEQIQDRAGLGKAETLDALDQLARLALVNWDGQEPTPAPQIVEPTTALYALLERQESEVAERKLRLTASRQAIDQLLASRTSEVASTGMERVVGLEAVRHKLQELSEGCEEYVWSLNPGGPQSAPNLDKARPLNEQTLRRGVQMRAIYQEAVHNDDPTVDYLKWLGSNGAEVRLAPVLPLRMIIVDGRQALVPMDENDSSRGALVLSGTSLLTGLRELFNATWRDARPFGPRTHRQRGDFSPQEREAVRLWARGMTDHSVARALGVSDRTIRRMSETVSSRLGAHSRFEAGAKARDAGLLDSEDLQ